MALGRVKTWVAAEVLSASDLNAEFNNILNNPLSLISPLTGALDANGNEIVLDADGDTSVTADSDDVIDWRIGGTDSIFFGHGTGNTAGFVHVDPLAHTVTASTDYGLIRVGNTNAVTIPAGTTAVVAGLYIEIPNWTASGTITNTASLYIEGPATEGGTDYALWVDEGVVKIDDTLDVATLIGTPVLAVANDGADTPFTLRNSATGDSSDETVSLIFQHVDANGPGGKIVSGREQDYSSGANEDGFLGFYTPLNGTDTKYLHITSAGLVTIGDTSAVTNAKMDQGLTVQQGAFDSEAIAIKSSDVDHPMTDLAETDTFGVAKKIISASGGLSLIGYSDVDRGIEIVGRGSTETTDNDTTSDACVVVAGQLNTSATVGDLGATGNVFAVKNNNTTLFLLEGDGDMHVTNRSAGAGDVVAAALDNEDDVGLIRTHQRLSHDDIGIAMTKWDDQVQANEEDLRRVGVLSYKSDFYSVQRMNSLMGGAIWQQHIRQSTLMELLEEELPGITVRMQAKLEAAKMPQLPL